MKPQAFRLLSAVGLLLLPACATIAQDPRPAQVQVVFSAEELDNLVAPIALYPDPLLAQILIAATYPDQVGIAARHVRERGTRGIEDEPWDLSVRAVAHYPPVLNMLSEDDDWAAALGQAYATQSADVMDAVQRLRDMAMQQGNLVSTQEQTVRVEREKIVIVPANPRVIYVPAYDPGVVFFRPVVHLGFRTSYWSFGIGFPIGDWLVYDLDWYGHRVYYDGWVGGGWRALARPYIVLRPVYVHPHYHIIHIGNVFGRTVNYWNLDRRYRRVHNTVTFVRHDRDGRGPGNRGREWGNDDRGPGRAGGPRNDRDGRNAPDDRPRPDDRDRRLGPDYFDGRRVPSFDAIRPERTGEPEARPQPTRSAGGFGTLDKRRVVPAPRAPVKVEPGPRPSAPAKASPRAPVTFSAPPRAVESRKPSASAPVRPAPAPRARIEPGKPPKASSGTSMRAATSRSAPAKVKPGGSGGGGGGKSRQ